MGNAMSRYTPTFEKKTAFGPDLVNAMCEAIDLVCEHRKIEPCDVRSRNAIAQSILALARDGIDDPIGLHDLYLAGATGLGNACFANRKD